jgi:hypothetical protein
MWQITVTSRKRNLLTGDYITNNTEARPLSDLKVLLMVEVDKGMQPLYHIVSQILRKRKSCDVIPFYTDQYVLRELKRTLPPLLELAKHHTGDPQAKNLFVTILIIFHGAFSITNWNYVYREYAERVTNNISPEQDVRAALKFLSLFGNFLQQELDLLPK